MCKSKDNIHWFPTHKVKDTMLNTSSSCCLFQDVWASQVQPLRTAELTHGWWSWVFSMVPVVLVPWGLLYLGWRSSTQNQNSHGSATEVDERNSVYFPASQHHLVFCIYTSLPLGRILDSVLTKQNSSGSLLPSAASLFKPEPSGPRAFSHQQGGAARGRLMTLARPIGHTSPETALSQWWLWGGPTCLQLLCLCSCTLIPA